MLAPKILPRCNHRQEGKKKTCSIHYKSSKLGPYGSGFRYSISFRQDQRVIKQSLTLDKAAFVRKFKKTQTGDGGGVVIKNTCCSYKAPGSILHIGMVAHNHPYSSSKASKPSDCPIVHRHPYEENRHTSQNIHI